MGSMILNWVLSIAGGIAAIGGAVTIVRQWLNPGLSLMASFRKLQEEHQLVLKQLEETRRRDQLVMEALLIVLNHDIHGNSIEQIQKIQNDILEYLSEVRK